EVEELLGECYFFFQAEDGIRDFHVTGVQTCALPISLGRAMLRLINPTAGKIEYNGIDLTSKPRRELRELRRDIQIVFQDPYSSQIGRASCRERGEAAGPASAVHERQRHLRAVRPA